jgi:hypothetical protein
VSFSRIDLLPRNNFEARRQARERWENEPGPQLYDYILSKIREGAGEDFLQWDFESGKLGFLKDYWDLAGMKLFNEEIVFPNGDNFENIDFSYSEFWHSKFTSACFPQTHFSFARLYNVSFKKCLFHLANFYGCEIEKCTFEDCDFVEGNGFSNCEIKDTTYRNCFMDENIFRNCRFDENVKIVNTKKSLAFGLLPRANDFQQEIKRDQISGIYRGIKDGFVAGEIFALSRRYLFLQLRAYTRYNEPRKIWAYLWEAVAGYGLKPQRVLCFLVLLFAVVFLIFWARLGNASDSLLLSAGAFLTFGAKVDLLEHLTMLDKAIYIASAFVGVSLVALFITVLANVLLKNN